MTHRNRVKRRALHYPPKELPQVGCPCFINTVWTKKNRHFALESTIFIRFKIVLNFWLACYTMKNLAKNCPSKLITNEFEAISANVGKGSCMQLKKRKFVVLLRLSIKKQFWKDQRILNMCVKFHLRNQNIHREKLRKTNFRFFSRRSDITSGNRFNFVRNQFR